MVAGSVAVRGPYKRSARMKSILRTCGTGDSADALHIPMLVLWAWLGQGRCTMSCPSRGAGWRVLPQETLWSEVRAAKPCTPLDPTCLS